MELGKLTDEELSTKYKVSDATLQNKILGEVQRRYEHETMLFSLANHLKIVRHSISYESLRDALMEAYIKLMNNQMNTKDNQAIKNLKAWLLLVAKRTFLNNLSKVDFVDLETTKNLFQEDFEEDFGDDFLYDSLILYASTAFLKDQEYDFFVEYYFEHKRQINYEQLAQNYQTDKRTVQTSLELSRRKLRKYLASAKETKLSFSPKDKADQIFEAILDYTDQTFLYNTDRQIILKALLGLLDTTEREVVIAYFFENEKQSRIIENFAKKRIRLDINFWNSLQQKLYEMISSIKYIFVLVQY